MFGRGKDGHGVGELRKAGTADWRTEDWSWSNLHILDAP